MKSTKKLDVSKCSKCKCTVYNGEGKSSCRNKSCPITINIDHKENQVKLPPVKK